MADAKGESHDFTHRQRIVERSAILAPANAPDWVYDRQTLWQRVREQEKRVDARWMQEVIASLPYGLDIEQRWEAATRLAKEIFVELGMIVDYSVHLYGARIKPGDEDFKEHMDQWKEKAIPFLEVADAIANNEAHVMVERDARNKIVGFRLRQPHIHFSLPTRSISLAGFGQKPEPWWRRGRIKEWRSAWEDIENEALEKAGRPERVDCRTLKAQGIDRKPQVPHGLAKRLKNPNEKMKERLHKSEDIHDYNQGIDIAGAVVRVVTAAMIGGPGAAVIAGLGELGLVPGIGSPEGSMIAGIVRNVERAVGVGR